MVTDAGPGSGAMPEAARQSLAKIERLLGRRRTASTKVIMKVKDEQIEVPEPAISLIHELVAKIVRGEDVSIVSAADTLTTQEAADLLHISRTYMVSLLEKGRLPFTKVGSHRRIRYDELIAFRKEFDARRTGALNRLTELSQEYGLYPD